MLTSNLALAPLSPCTSPLAQHFSASSTIRKKKLNTQIWWLRLHGACNLTKHTQQTDIYSSNSADDQQEVFLEDILVLYKLGQVRQARKKISTMSKQLSSITVIAKLILHDFIIYFTLLYDLLGTVLALTSLLGTGVLCRLTTAPIWLLLGREWK